MVLEECPRTYITAESEAMVEEFFVRRRMGGIVFSELTARQVDAFMILETTLLGEIKRGQEFRGATGREFQ